MLNNVILVGRVATKPEVKKFEDGTKVADFMLAVERPFKSQDGKQESDFFKVSVWQGYADVVRDYCGVGSVIGVKARLAAKKLDIEGKKYSMIEVIGERVAFIHTVKPGEKEDETVDIGEAELNDKVEKLTAKKK